MTADVPCAPGALAGPHKCSDCDVNTVAACDMCADRGRLSNDQPCPRGCRILDGWRERRENAESYDRDSGGVHSYISRYATGASAGRWFWQATYESVAVNGIVATRADAERMCRKVVPVLEAANEAVDVMVKEGR